MPAHSDALLPIDYLLMAKRRAGLIFCTVLLALLAGAVLIKLLPPSFRSSGVILVEAQQIPATLLPEAVGSFVNERVNVISQRVLTRENLLALDNRFAINGGGKSVAAAERIETLQAMIAVTPLAGSDHARDRTVAFEVAFEAENPRLAHDVANELVTLFLSENARIRRQQAADATRFLAREAEKLERELALFDRQLAAYKQRHSETLPEHLELRMAMLQRLEADDKAVERELRSSEEQLRFLEVEMAAVQSGLVEAAAPFSESTGTRSLAQLRADYEALRLQYTDEYPDLQQLAERIRSAEATQGAGSEASEASLRRARIQAQINSGEARLTSLAAQRQELRDNMASLQQQIIQTPQVQRQLSKIMRDYANARAKYEEVRDKQIDASIRQTMVEENIAEHFSLLDPPLLPTEPFRPDRMKVMVVALLGGVAAAALLVLWLEARDPRLRGAHAIEQLVRRPPLAIIPPLGPLPLRRWQRLRGGRWRRHRPRAEVPA